MDQDSHIDLGQRSVRPKQTITRTESISPRRRSKPRTDSKRREHSKETKRKATEQLNLSETWSQELLLDNQLGTIEAEAVGLKFFKSSLDKIRLPDAVDNDYFLDEIKKQNDFGLKMTATKGDQKFILGLIVDKTIKLNKYNITIIPHDQFRKLPRINIIKIHKKTKQTTPK